MLPCEGELIEITDVTQMTLFTAELLLQAWTTARHSGGVPNFSAALQRSYQCWFRTQGEQLSPRYPVSSHDG
jgi:hypothetical protein